MSVLLFRLPCVSEVLHRRSWVVVREHGWAYSSGLWGGYRHPEVAIFGIPPHRWGLVNIVAELVSGGLELRSGMVVDDVLLGSRVAVRRIDPSWWARLFRAPVAPEYVQIVWPDRDGWFPWEPAASDHRRTRLWLPVDDHRPQRRATAPRIAGSWHG